MPPRLKVPIILNTKWGEFDLSWRTVWNAGGWCPKGRKAEDGSIDPKYPLKETPSASYIQRTEWNVRDSDATVLFSIDPALSGGSKKTLEFAHKHKKPHLHLCAGDNAAADKLRRSLKSIV
jgi:Circularly permutated YpsA SLOG family